MIVLVQYGQTEGSEKKMLVGRRHDPLTTAGIELAHGYAEALGGIQFDRAYCARKVAPVDTIHLILDRVRGETPYVDVQQIDELIEPDGGHFEGRLYSELKRMLPPRQYRLWDRDYFSAPFGGESMADLSTRVLRWFDPIQAEHTDKTILIVVGPQVMKVLLGRIQSMEEADICALEPLFLPYSFDGREW